jgi:methyl-accepting chemotaxis protein
MKMTLKKRLLLGFTSNLMLLPVYLGIFMWSTVSAIDLDKVRDGLTEQGRHADEVIRLSRRLPDAQAFATAREAILAEASFFEGPSIAGDDAIKTSARELGKQLRELAAAPAPAPEALTAVQQRAGDILQLGWTAFAKNKGEMQGIQKRTASFVFAFLVVAVLLVFFVSIFISRSITRPLASFSKAAKAIGEGDLSQKVELPPDLELRVLAESFNHMRDRLAELMARLKSHTQEASSTAASIMGTATQMADGAKQQSAATEETSSAMEEIAAQIQGVSRNAVDLANDASSAAGSAKQIRTSAEAVSHAAQDLHGAIERSAATVEEVAKTAQASASDLTTAEQFTHQISTEAEDGGDALDSSIGKIQSVGEASLVTSKAFEALDQRSRQITGIVEMMAEIADQTNLLALNAAIEAARAGDSGRGFAVVADEVRKLAERSLAAAKEVAGLIGSIREETEKAVGFARQNADRISDGARLLADTGSRMRRVVDSVRRVSEIVTRVNAAVGAQSNASAELKREMERLRGLSGLLSGNAGTQVASAGEVVQAVERISSRTRQVADATVQVRAGGDQVVKSAENISVIARQNQDAVHKVTAEMQALALRVGELNDQASNLRLEAKA